MVKSDLVKLFSYFLIFISIEFRENDESTLCIRIVYNYQLHYSFLFFLQQFIRNPEAITIVAAQRSINLISSQSFSLFTSPFVLRFPILPSLNQLVYSTLSIYPKKKWSTIESYLPNQLVEFFIDNRCRNVQTNWFNYFLT